MKVSQIASGIYQSAKSAAAKAGSKWDWRKEWQKAMKAAWKQIINTFKEAIVVMVEIAKEIRIRIETSAYNARRYGKPWIARVDKDMDFSFGRFFGDDSKGVTEVTAAVGSIIASGQKDFRKPKNSAPAYYKVLVDGSLEAMEKAEAYKHLNP